MQNVTCQVRRMHAWRGRCAQNFTRKVSHLGLEILVDKTHYENRLKMWWRKGHINPHPIYDISHQQSAVFSLQQQFHCGEDSEELSKWKKERKKKKKKV
jgi:hypothetical protein